MLLFKGRGTFLSTDISKLFNNFIEGERTAGFILVVCTLLSLTIANSALSLSYINFWHTHVGPAPLETWINDFLMAVFFLSVGLEIKRELYIGELSDTKNALLPVVAALGGMVVPAGIHYFFNHGLDTASGAGIPMATDIAFALGILSLLGKRVPVQLKVFLVALAIIDDLGAIVIIGIFYTPAVSWLYLSAAAGILLFSIFLNRIKITNLFIYLVSGLCLWYFVLQSGIHATIAGVLLAFVIPFGKYEVRSPALRLKKALHLPVNYIILPLFVLANTCIVIGSSWTNSLFTPNSTGILLGLLLGKPIGIMLFSYLLIKSNYSRLPDQVSWLQLCGAGILGGIGFTMSIFISILASGNHTFVENSKIAVLAASCISGFIGLIFLSITLRTKSTA